MPESKLLLFDPLAEERGEKKRWLADLLKMSYDTINRWLSRIDKDSEEERQIAVQNLHLQGFTQEESAKLIFGENTDATKKKIARIWDDICKYKICPIPGLFTEDQPEDSAPEWVKREVRFRNRGEKLIAVGIVFFSIEIG